MRTFLEHNLCFGRMIRGTSGLLASLILLPPFFRILHAEAMLEHLPDFFKCHLRSLGETEEDKQPAKGTKTSVEACARASKYPV